MVATATRETEYPEHPGPLSIKCVFSGTELYELEGGARIRLVPDSYLVLNHGHRYAGHIRSPFEVRCLSVFFRTGFADEILHSLVTPADRLLDDPAATSQGVAFFEKLYPHDDTVTPKLVGLDAALARGPVDAAWLEEQFHALLEGLLGVHRDIYPEIDELPAVRLSTRLELYRRLHRARDHMESSFSQSLDLKQIAGVACLSPHHFLRLFKRFFGETPHQYVIRRRLEKAAELLRRTDLSVTEICLEVGLESLGSFSSSFHRRLGVSPSTYRLRYQPESGVRPGGRRRGVDAR